MFETERLNFRITEVADEAALCKCLNTPEMTGAISFLSYPYTTEQAKHWIYRAKMGTVGRTEWLFSVFTKTDGNYIGSVNIHKRQDNQAEMGYWVCRESQKNGFASEMVKGAVKFAFKDLKLDMIYATTAVDNPASQKILVKNGFIKAGETKVKTPTGLRLSWMYQINNKG